MTRRRSVTALFSAALWLLGCPSPDTERAPSSTPTVTSVASSSASADVSSAPPAGNTANAQAVTKLGQAIAEKYSYRDRLGLDWTKLLEAARPDLEDAASAQEFADRLAKILAAAQDPHIWIDVAGGKRVGTRATPPTGNFELKALRALLDKPNQHNPCVASGRLKNGGYGYVLIATWDKNECNVIDLGAGIVAAIDDLKDAPGLVIDVRPNRGGDENVARVVAGPFVDKDTLYAKRELRDATQPSGFRAPFAVTLPPRSTSSRWAKPVVVLMGPINMSSCESFLMMMREAGAKLIGERSLGSSGNPQPHDLGNGVTVFLPSWRALFKDGSLLEGNGVVPDVEVKTTAADFASGDPILDVAVKTLATMKP